MLILHQCQLRKKHVGQVLACLAGVPKWRGRGNLGTRSECNGCARRGKFPFSSSLWARFPLSLPRMNASLIDSLAVVLAPRAVIKSWGPGIPLATMNMVQHAKKVVSDSPGLLNLAIRLVIFVLNLPHEQVLYFGGNSNYRKIVINPANQKGFWG